MNERIIATGPIIARAGNSLPWRIILTAYFDGNGIISKYATHRQSFDGGVASKFDGSYFEGFNEPDKMKLQKTAVASFNYRVSESVADYPLASAEELGEIDLYQAR